MENYRMADSFMQNHQSALDSQMEDKAIQDLEDAGIYPVPDNHAVLENLYDEAYDYFSKQHPDWEEEHICHVAEKSAKRQFEELPEPGDYDD